MKYFQRKPCSDPLHLWYRIQKNETASLLRVFIFFKHFLCDLILVENKFDKWTIFLIFLKLIARKEKIYKERKKTEMFLQSVAHVLPGQLAWNVA